MKKLTDREIHIIKQKIPIDKNKFIVRLNVAGNKTIPLEEANKNIYCVNDKNEVIWQIEAEPSNFDRDSFVNMQISNSELIAKRFFGFKYLVNLKTGRAKEIGWEK